MIRQMRLKFFAPLSVLLTILNLLWTFCLLENNIFQYQINKSVAALTEPLHESKHTNYNVLYDSVRVSSEKPSEDIFDLAFGNVEFGIGRWDSQRLYKMYDFALVGDAFVQTSSNSLVCLATQSSIERLHSLVQVAKQWSGPISVAVYVAGNEEFVILQYYVTYLRLCFPFIRKNVTFHLAVPHDKIPTHDYKRSVMDRFDCQYPEQTLRQLLKMRSSDTMRWRLKKEYPQNHMRNLARKGCQNKYVFLTDIDIIPTANSVPLLNVFLSSALCSKCAYVIPTFEIDIRAKFPYSKGELLRLHKKGLVRPFHEKVFIYNQYATNFSSWLTNSTQLDTKAYISHTVTNFEFLYEPFYIALDNVPAHDERFIGYGFTRNSQVYEMYIAGYTFHVLSPIFTCHWGLQHKKERPAWREQQNNVNRKRFERFKNEIFARYKKSSVTKFK